MTRRVLGGDRERHGAEEVLSQEELAILYGWIDAPNRPVTLDPALVGIVAGLQRGAA